jgi:hypothetical protein
VPVIGGVGGGTVEGQLGSGLGLPKQTSHFSQVLLHEGLGVQRGHLAGSPKLAAVQVGTSRTAKGWPGIAQHPKQSHPLGVMLRHLLMQVCGWLVGHMTPPL